MEARLEEVNNAIPARHVICALAEKFSASPERAGKIAVQPKQVWNWFQNRRYAQRAKSTKASAKLTVSPMAQDDLPSIRNVVPPVPVPTGRNSLENGQMEFEAKSARDGAWYDVQAFLSHRMFEIGDPEVRVRFQGFGMEEDEWVNVRRCVRQRSLPCEAAECVAVLQGDLILCFQEGKEQALYFDAHVLDAQRRRHDLRGCRCRFLVRYDHDQSEEIVPLRKVCRRPETDYRLQILQASRGASGAMDQRAMVKAPTSIPKDINPIVTNRTNLKQQKLMDVNTDEVLTVLPAAVPNTDTNTKEEPTIGGDQFAYTSPIPPHTVSHSNSTIPDVTMGDAVPPGNSTNSDYPQEGNVEV
ncbi:protein SAWADEE HOMEODOMAIN HOMOLOG 2-like isoform X2 [Ananas comosus]|nr:protein SAWADEE HOMEODOMAIN HOMOLOG 2-like isoform X2 [Ananas comosus]XP_020084358.1 protein SAWADEE HOMEODOMAIN HOMOLOG 2-like isoform X2 [Ananas comosus]XP_020084360.1 protein SAWADEE HOMEODOMAIN HOMOLOG 2-like isoform X2 [Ananas comosus]